MKVYTKTGDRGTTSLVGGQRVGKDDPRIEAYGTVDELMAFVALLRDSMADEKRCQTLSEELLVVLDRLMRIASLLAAEGPVQKQMPKMEAEDLHTLEGWIDRMQEQLPPIRSFTLPGGHPLVSLTHVCRTVCRRAERRIVALTSQIGVNENVSGYINRLSDYFYVIGRKISCDFDVKELLWKVDN